MRHRYDQETKERAVRMFEQRREEQPEESRKQALVHLSGLLGVPPDTIRGWVDRARVDAGEKPGVTTAALCARAGICGEPVSVARR